MTDGTISGLDAFQQSIAELNQEVREQLPALVMTAAAVVESEIRARAPVDTGRLVRSLDAKAERRLDAASAIVQIERSSPDGTEHYAIFQEFGTSRMPARPFFRPGVEAAKNKVLTLVEGGIVQTIEEGR